MPYLPPLTRGLTRGPSRPPRPPRAWAPAWLLSLALALCAPTGTASADDPQCTVLLAQAQEMLAEAEQQALRGQEAKSEGVAVRALALVDRAFGLCPDSRDAAGLGVLLSSFAGDVEGGQAWLARFEERTPFGERDPQLHYFRAVVQVRLISRPDLGVRSLERMQALAPGLHVTQRDSLYYEGLMLQGSQLNVEARHAEALRLFRAAEGVARRGGKLGRERRALAMVGITYGASERHKEAAEVFKKLQQDDPTHPVWPYQLGLALAQLFKYDEAIERYRTSLELQKGYEDTPRVLADLGRARLRLGNCLRLKAGSLSPDDPKREAVLAEALAELTRFHQEHPKDPLGPLWIGVLFNDERNDQLTAIGWFEKALALDPDCTSTLDYLITAHRRAGSPVPPDAPEPTEAQWAAWNAKREAWVKEKADGADRRKARLDERARLTGDSTGGCL